MFLSKRDRTKPFCLSISFKAPHSEDGVADNNGFRPDPFFNGWYNNVQFPYPETANDSFYYRFPAAWRKSAFNKENEGRVRWEGRFSPDRFQTTYRAIYRLVSGVDKVVGELRDYLKAAGLDRNTILVFTSDNGYYMGEHGLEGKWYGHEESIRTPLIIYDPRMPQQRKVVEEMVLNIDLAPTILSWAQIDVPAQMQGKPLQPLLAGSVSGWREDFFYEHPYDAGTEAYIPKTVGLVTSNWKYMRYYNGKFSNKGVVYEELFDVSSDPYEKKNRINDPAQKSRVWSMKNKVAQYERQLR
jgi:arylsulfatase A-like enzyme